MEMEMEMETKKSTRTSARRTTGLALTGLVVAATAATLRTGAQA